MTDSLELVLVLLAYAMLVVVLARSLHLPPQKSACCRGNEIRGPVATTPRVGSGAAQRYTKV